MDDLYRDYILEHYRRPHNFGVIEDADASYEGANPLCGDRITLMLGVKDGVVDRVGFTGRGCAISQASASLLTDEIKGKPLARRRGLPRRRPARPARHRDQPRSPQVRDAQPREPPARPHGPRRDRRRGRAHDPDRAPLQVSSAGLSAGPDAPVLPPRPSRTAPPGTTHRPGADGASPSTIGVQPSPMPKSYADLLREARAQIREVTPQEVDALAPGAAKVIDVREASEWEQGHLPGATHISKSYIEQQIEAAAPDRDAPVVLYCAGGVRSLFAAQTLAGDGLHRRRVDVRRLPGVEGRGPRVRDAGRPDRRAEAALQPPPADPRGRLGRPGEAPRLEGAAHRRRRPRLARRRSTSRRRASARSASSTSTSSTSATSSARSSTRPTGWGSARSNRRKRSINALNPDIKVVAHEEMLVARQRRADHRRLRRHPRRDRHVRDPLHPQRRRGRGRASRSSTPRSSGSRASSRRSSRTKARATAACTRPRRRPSSPPAAPWPASSASCPAILGLLQANEALKVLLGIGNTLAGRLLLFDALETEFTELKLRRDPECPVCSDKAVAARKAGHPLTVDSVGDDVPFVMTTTGLAGTVSPDARA